MKKENIDFLDVLKYISNSYGTNFDISNGMQELKNVFTPKKKTLYILLDALGYYKVQSLDSTSILKKNCLKKIETLIPTSTACIFNSLYTGKYPYEHGKFGWWSYSKKRDLSYTVLPVINRFSDKSLEDENIQLDEIYDLDCIFSKFKFPVNIYLEDDLVNSTFQNAFFEGIENVKRNEFKNMKDAFEKVTKDLKENNEKSFNLLYFDDLDINSHICGPDSENAGLVISDFEKYIQILVDEKIEDLSIVVVADHGQVPIYKTIYLNEKHDFDKYFYAAPSCDTRMQFFFVKKECIPEFKEKFKENFEKYFDLYEKDKFKEIFKAPYFSEMAEDAMGEFVSIAKKNVVFTFEKYDKQLTLGGHSALTKQELYTPLICI
ncbi:MAG: alkaline phosphatase family protein [Clostridia bacterium]